MKLERLALWAEKSLFTEQGETDKGFVGWLKGNFGTGELSLSDMEPAGDGDRMLRYEIESLCIFLASESAGYMLRALADLKAFCRDKVHDHIPYAFNRECLGFRVLTDDYAWYIALTPWNAKRQFCFYCYDRKALMTALAKEKGLPESCYGVLKYTGERIRIRYGEDMYESFPQYGGNMVENRAFADEQNAETHLTKRAI